MAASPYSGSPYAASPYDEWADIYDAVYSYVVEDIPFYADEAVAAAADGGAVLELGCGTGRVAIPVAKAVAAAHSGGCVVGLDSSSAMLSRARRNADAAGVAGCLTLVQGDMRDFAFSRRFSLITIPFRGMLSLLSVEDQTRALMNIKRHLAPGGRLVFDIFAPDLGIMALDSDVPYHFRDVTDPASGRRMVIYLQTRYDDYTQIMSVRAIIEELDGGGAVQRKLYRDFALRYIHRWEMAHLLRACGYDVLDMHGDFRRGEFGPDSGNMIWIATPR